MDSLLQIRFGDFLKIVATRRGKRTAEILERKIVDQLQPPLSREQILNQNLKGIIAVCQFTNAMELFRYRTSLEQWVRQSRAEGWNTVLGKRFVRFPEDADT